MTTERINIEDKVATLKKLSYKILTTMLDVMKILVDDKNDLSEEIVHNLNISEEHITQINDWLQKYCTDLIVTAEAVSKEIDKFSSAYKEGDDELDKKMKDYPSLAEVWYGDTYGTTGIDGLNSLIKDLELDLSNTSDGKIIDLACKQDFVK